MPNWTRDDGTSAFNDESDSLPMLHDSKWKPINTAPRNEYVLVFSDGDVCIGVLWSNYTRWKSDGYAESATAEKTLENVTHWMPLPSPPKETN